MKVHKKYRARAHCDLPDFMTVKSGRKNQTYGLFMLNANKCVWLYNEDGRKTKTYVKRRDQVPLQYYSNYTTTVTSFYYHWATSQTITFVYIPRCSGVLLIVNVSVMQRLYVFIFKHND